MLSIYVLRVRMCKQFEFRIDLLYGAIWLGGSAKHAFSEEM